MVIFQVAFTVAPRSAPLPHSHYLMGYAGPHRLGCRVRDPWVLECVQGAKGPGAAVRLPSLI